MKQQQGLRREAIHSISSIYAGNLVTHIFENRVLMGEDAANMVCERINQLLEEQSFVNIIFAAAPSQNEFLDALTQNTSVNWECINAFHMDEYIGLPENDPAAFSSFLKGKIFNYLPFNSVNLINGNAVNTKAECMRYAELLLKYPPDIICMGIGENGHIAFNDPHVADFNDPLQVKVVSLDLACRQQQVNDGCFSTLHYVPTHAITLTIPALMEGKYIYCIVPGEKKARAVYNTLHAQITEKHPSTILRKHTDAILFLDEDSGSLL
jgi:glucosamine-6-phosphate deaminase